jgi:PTH1 family peptidyl-tRNA hydrolase
MKLVIGLGNPGTQYAGTRHNVGFEVVDVLARSARADRFLRRFEADIAEADESGEKVLYAKPQTFMNVSGRSVRQIVDFYKIGIGDLLVVCDDVNLPVGKLRVRPGGSPGGHNGLKDIERHVGTAEYARLRIGVGAPERADMADYVLARFRPSERPVIEDAIVTAAQAVGLWLRQGTAACMNQFNSDAKTEKKKPPKAKGAEKKPEASDSV